MHTLKLGNITHTILREDDEILREHTLLVITVSFLIRNTIPFTVHNYIVYFCRCNRTLHDDLLRRIIVFGSLQIPDQTNTFSVNARPHIVDIYRQSINEGLCRNVKN